MRAYGAAVEEGGRDFDEARERCERRAADSGARYVHSANEPLLLAGVGTYALELFEELPNADVIFVPIGGGSGACGLITVRNALGSGAKIIGVGATKADAIYRSWKGPDRVVGESADTFAEGIATRVTFDLTFSIYQQYLDDFMLLTEDELAAGVRLALQTTHNLAEGAGAAALAAAYQRRGDLAGMRVACVMTGGNIDRAKLKMVLG
jgi:threonine dehydratase